MDADLTCPACKGALINPKADPLRTTTVCFDCIDGRRRPTLAEYDALRAERDRFEAERNAYRAMLGFIAENAASAHHARYSARSALDIEEGKSLDSDGS